MAVNPAPRDPYRPGPRGLARLPPSKFTSGASVFWIILTTALAAAFLIWALGTSTSHKEPDTNAGPSLKTQPAMPNLPPEPATRPASTP